MNADKVTPDWIKFFIKHTSGIVCIGMREIDLKRLNLPLMV